MERTEARLGQKPVTDNVYQDLAAKRIPSGRGSTPYLMIYALEEGVGPHESSCLIVQDNAQEGSVDVETAIVPNEA
jgi:hypothetical protein